MTNGEHGQGRGNKDDDTEFGQEVQLQYDAFNLFDYGDAPPLSPYPSSPLEALAPLQRNVEVDVSDGGNALVEAMYKGQGRQLGERSSLVFFVMLLLVVVDVLVAVVL